jgi:pimeloyl-ACP methyl ester carboxylesterase
MCVSAGKKQAPAPGRALGVALASAAGGLALGGAGLVAWANRRLPQVETLDLDDAPAGHFITVDGVRLHYLDGGTAPPGQPPVVLLHGFGASGYSWRHTFPTLAEHTRVLVPDLMGFGYSERVARPEYTLRRHADLVAGFLQALGVERAIVVGNSMGGAVALQLAIRRPACVAALVVVDAAMGGGETRRPPPAVASLLFGGPLGPAFIYFTFGNPRFLRRAVALSYANPDRFSPLVAEGYQTPLRVRGTAAALVAMTVSPMDDDLPEAIQQITAPTLIIWGEQDRLIPVRVSEELHRLIPHSRLHRLPNCGHLPQEECPAEFNAALLAFLGE